MEKQKILTAYKLNQLSTQKFITTWEALMDGEFVYKTLDDRIIDFKAGTERQEISRITIRRG